MTQPPRINGPARTRQHTPVSRGAAIVASVLFMALGWLFVVLALQAGHDAADAEYTGTPVCDGQLMRPGDSCFAFGSGAGVSGSYEDIVADNERTAKAEAWAWVEVQGTLGIALVFFGVGMAGFGAGLRAKANAWVFTCLALVPMLGVAAVVWWLQSRVNAASSVPVGILGILLPELSDMHHSAVQTLIVVTIVAVGYLGKVFDTGTATATDSPRQPVTNSFSTSNTWGGSVPTETYRKATEKEERRKAWAQRTKEASDAFDKGRTDDPWAADRATPYADGVPPARLSTRGARLTRTLGTAVYFLACALGTGHSALPALGIELPIEAAPALTALVGWVLFTARARWNFPAGEVAWAYGGFALLSLAAALTTVLSLPVITWSGLLNTLVFTCGFLMLTAWFGPSLTRPAVAGRIIYTVNGLVQLLVAAGLLIAARTPGLRLLAYLVAVVFVVSGWRSFVHARKTESLGAVPSPVSAACLGSSALVLALIACGVAYADIGPLSWVVVAGYTLLSLVLARSAFGHAKGVGRTTTPRSETVR